MKEPRESDGPGTLSAPWWAWLVIGICIGILFILIQPDSSNAKTIFKYNFNGPLGQEPGYPWKLQQNKCYLIYPTHTCISAYKNGDGKLVLPVTSTSGPFYATFDYGSWPARTVYASFQSPLTFSVRMKMPKKHGVWAGGLWALQTDRFNWQGMDELDLAEERSSVRGLSECWHHYINDRNRDGLINRSRSANEDVLKHSYRRINTWNWHTYRVKVARSYTKYTIDNRPCMTIASAKQGRFGLLFNSFAGGPNPWVFNYEPLNFTGTARTLIDFIEVSRP